MLGQASSETSGNRWRCEIRVSDDPIFRRADGKSAHRAFHVAQVSPPQVAARACKTGMFRLARGRASRSNLAETSSVDLLAHQSLVLLPIRQEADRKPSKPLACLISSKSSCMTTARE
jgi:hypothetical protein